MQKTIISLAAPLAVGILALALGWFAHAAVPLSAQGIAVDGRASLADPASPAAPVSLGGARLTYQGRLTDKNSGAPINTSVSIVFKLYDSTDTLLWTSSPTRTITPTNGLFTVYLGDGADSDFFDLYLPKAASIGVTVGGDLEMKPHQALNSVVGHSEYRVGVTGSSNQGDGVFGSSRGNVGVHGFSEFGNGVWGDSRSGFNGVLGTSEFGDGVVGSTGVITKAGVLASSTIISGTALEIGSGGIKATGAGGDTSTFAFIHVTSAGNTFGTEFTEIDNALTNGDQNAMLFATHVNNPPLVGENVFTRTVGVIWLPFDSKWAIYTEDGTAFPSGVSFNVMVIKR